MKQERCHDQRTLNSFLKPQVADRIETAAEIINVPVNINNTTVNISKDSETSPTDLKNHKDFKISIDDNQQVFQLAPPIVLQQ